MKLSNGNGWVSGIHMSVLEMDYVLAVMIMIMHDMLQVTIGKDVNSYSIDYTFAWLVPLKDKT